MKVARKRHSWQRGPGFVAWVAVIFAVIFLLNFWAMSTYFPASKPLVNTVHPHELHKENRLHTTEKEEEECPEYGCPIYPAEVTPYLQELLSEIFISKTRKETFSFGTKTMAMLTQMGKSHFYNQDRAVVVAPFHTSATEGDESSFLVGLFDGHGQEGHIVADHVAREFPERLADELNALEDFSDQAIVACLNKTFVEVDIYAPPDFLLGGCTASVTFRRGSKLYVANAGDSQTILVSVDDNGEPKVVYMSRKDKASIPEEFDRIKGLGGNVHMGPNNQDARVIV
jgi:hypothetical protein